MLQMVLVSELTHEAQASRDELSVRELSTEVLRRGGYDVRTGTNGAEGVALVQQHAATIDALAAPGSYLAGFIFERSKQPGEALRYYDEALRGGGGAVGSSPS